MKLADKTAVVTGAASGIGRAIARLFKAEGAEVIAVDMDEERLAKVATELECESVLADITTEDGIAAMKGERPTRLLLPPLKEAGRRTSGRSRGRGSSPPEDELDAAQGALFEALRAHRLEVARDEGVPPYVVASDRALRDIARLQPADFETLQLANGIGPNKAARYGDGLLAVVRDHFR